MLQHVVCSNYRAFYTACKLQCLHLKQISTFFFNFLGPGWPINLKMKSDTICFLWIHVPVVLNNHEGSARSSKNKACPIGANFLAQSPLEISNIRVVFLFVCLFVCFACPKWNKICSVPVWNDGDLRMEPEGPILGSVNVYSITIGNEGKFSRDSRTLLCLIPRHSGSLRKQLHA